MYRLKVIIFLLFFWGCLAAQEEKFSVGPLPPIGISLNAPLQIDEGNTDAQELFIESTPQRLTSLIKVKEFPIEVLLLLSFFILTYFLATKMLPAPTVNVPPPLTEDQRIEIAQQILTNADEVLSNEEALSLFKVLDPMIESLPDPQHYLQTAEQVKFAGMPLKKTEMQTQL